MGSTGQYILLHVLINLYLSLVYVLDKYLILVFYDISVICLLVNKVEPRSNSTVGSAIQ